MIRILVLIRRSQTLLVASLFLFLSACGGPLDVAANLLGSGPNVNAQVGKTNQQGINITASPQAPRTSIAPKGRVGSIDQSTNNYISMPPWVLLVIAVLAAGGAVGWVDNIQRWIKGK